MLQAPCLGAHRLHTARINCVQIQSELIVVIESAISFTFWIETTTHKDGPWF